MRRIVILTVLAISFLLPTLWAQTGHRDEVRYSPKTRYPVIEEKS